MKQDIFKTREENSSMKTRLMKFISTFISVVMLYHTAAIPLAQASMLAGPTGATSVGLPWASSKTLMFPLSIAEVAKIHQPAKTKRMVAHIQDIHGHVPSQINLFHVISTLEKNARQQGKKLLVAIEGVTGPVNTDLISSIPNQQAKESVGAGLLNSGVIFGEEYAAIINAPGRVQLVGVETPSLYRTNYLAGETTIKQRETALGVVKEIRRQLEKLEPHNFNTLLSTLQKNHRLADEGVMPTTDYVSFLWSVNPALMASFPGLARINAVASQESRFDQSVITKETEMAMADIFQHQPDRVVQHIATQAEWLKQNKISPATFYAELLSASKNPSDVLKAYATYLKKIDTIDADLVFEELDQAEVALAQSLVKHPLAGELFAYSRWAQRQERFFSLSMIPQEWQRQKDTTLASFLGVYQKIKNFTADQNMVLGYGFTTPQFPTAGLRAAFEGAKNFYSAAEARDVSLADNTRQLLSQYPADQFDVVLIAGGFHTDGILSQFEKHNIGTVVIRPQLDTPITLNTPYSFPGLRAKYDEVFKKSLLANSMRAPGATAVNPNPVADTVKQQSAVNPTEPTTPTDPSRPQQKLSIALFGALVLGADQWLKAFPGLHEISLTISGLVLAAVIALPLLGISIHSDADSTPVVFHPLPQPKTTSSDKLTEDDIQKLNSLGNPSTFGLKMSEIIYMAVQWLDMRRPQTGTTAQKLMPLGNQREIDLEQIKKSPLEDSANFILNSFMSEADDRRIMGKITADEIYEESHANLEASRNLTIIANAMDAGLGENFTREGYVRETRRQATGVYSPAKISAKGTDTGYFLILKRKRIMTSDHTSNIEEVNERVFLSVAEIKLLQIYLQAKNNDFQSIALQPLVNKDSRESYVKLLDQIFLLDRLDDTQLRKRTYRQILLEVGIDLQSFHSQSDIPLVAEDTLKIADSSDAPRQPGGHAQLGFEFFFDAMKRAREKTAANTIRFFFNGDNINSQIDRNIAGYMARKGHAIYMLTTAATPFDVKGGKLGAQIVMVNGTSVFVPDMMEYGVAKKGGQNDVDMFIKAGQKNGLGREGQQMFNTNMQYQNVQVIGDILNELVEVLNSDNQAASEFEKDVELAKAFAPTRVPKSKAIKGVKYIVPDGAIGNSVLNLNAFFLTTQNARIKEILVKRGMDRLVHFIDVPRSQFAPNKFPPDHAFFTNTSRFIVNPDNWTLIDQNPHAPMPSYEFIENPETTRTNDWAKDAGDWADLQTIIDATAGTDILHLSNLTFYGKPVRINGAGLKGRVWIHNKTNNVIDLNSDEFYVALDALYIEDRLNLDDVKITINEDRSVSVESLKTTFPRINHSFGLLALLAMAEFSFKDNTAVMFIAMVGFLIIGARMLSGNGNIYATEKLQQTKPSGIPIDSFKAQVTADIAQNPLREREAFAAGMKQWRAEQAPVDAETGNTVVVDLDSAGSALEIEQQLRLLVAMNKNIGQLGAQPKELSTIIFTTSDPRHPMLNKIAPFNSRLDGIKLQTKVLSDNQDIKATLNKENSPRFYVLGINSDEHQEKYSVAISNIGELALATFVFSHFKAPQDALTSLLQSFKNLKISISNEAEIMKLIAIMA
jgi:hypothetical protein